MSVLPRFLTISIILVAAAFAAAPQAQRTFQGKPLTAEQATTARELINAHRCPCGCGHYLPGSKSQPACFGCSVGKWDVSFIIEGLSDGRSRGDIVLDLTQNMLIDVFADYGDPTLPEVWERARRIAGESDIERVVLRPMGRSENGVTALKLVEFARGAGRFAQMHELLITWEGPWDDRSLTRLATEIGLSEDDARAFMREADVTAQINKNRQHAQMREINGLPAVTVNGEPVADTDDALRRAIRKVMLEDSM
ncbi:MAG: DsbA family protein [Candidatus Krumholzibacteriota bacterium]|nr:DsbA family protein [Candidatus Krumholzibacteriota bacterium]